MNRADADVIDVELRSVVDLGRGVRGQSHDAILPDQRTSQRHRDVVLPHVNPVGSRGVEPDPDGR